MRRVLHFFADLSDGDIDFIAKSGVARSVSPGTVLVDPGRELDAMHIVLSGCLEVRAGDRLIRDLYVGEIIGELSFLDRRPPSATVVAREPSRLLSLSRVDLDQKIANDLGFASRFYKSLGTFLAIRLRDITATLAYGDGQPDPDELDLDELDGAERAARKFAWLIETFGA